MRRRVGGSSPRCRVRYADLTSTKSMKYRIHRKIHMMLACDACLQVLDLGIMLTNRKRCPVEDGRTITQAGSEDPPREGKGCQVHPEYEGKKLILPAPDNIARGYHRRIVQAVFYFHGHKMQQREKSGNTQHGTLQRLSGAKPPGLLHTMTTGTKITWSPRVPRRCIDTARRIRM